MLGEPCTCTSSRGRTPRAMSIARPGMLAIVCLGLAGCSSGLPSLPFSSSKPDTAATAHVPPAEQLYNRADNLLSRGQYKGAALAFENVDREYPYSPFARRALALTAFAHYKGEDYPAAIKAGRRYTTLHSGTKDAALAHHVICLLYTSPSPRDQRGSRMPSSA